MRLRRQTLTFTTTRLKEFLADQQSRREEVATKHKVLLRSYKSSTLTPTSPTAPNMPAFPTTPGTQWEQASKHQWLGLYKGEDPQSETWLWGTRRSGPFRSEMLNLFQKKRKLLKTAVAVIYRNTRLYFLLQDKSFQENLKEWSHVKRTLTTWLHFFYSVDLVQTRQDGVFKFVPQGL